jgi:phosphoglycerate dehydrogenase-like enzyme
MPKVLFLTSLSAEIVPLLTQYAPAGFEVDVQPPTLPEAKQQALLAEADFLILFPSRIAEPALRAGRKLRLIQLVSVGFDSMNLPLCRELGIPVANNGGTNSIDVAEHTLALILAAYRRLTAFDRHVRADRWRALDSGLTTYTIQGKTVGIVGLGQIGQRVAGLLRPFGAELLYYDPYPPAAERERELGVRRASLEELLQQSDIVTLHVPLFPETRGLIGQRELAMMKPTALLVNTCRGPVVDEAALTEALRTGQIMGAALDVLEKEPPDPANPLLTLENVLFTPHTAGVTYDTWPRRGEFIFQNLQRVWAGETPLAVVSEA